MILAKGIIGNALEDKKYKELYEKYHENKKLEKILISSRDRNKNKMRATTDKNNDVGITLDGNSKLSSGDIIFCDDNVMIVVEVEKDQALVVDFDKGMTNHELFVEAIKFGHLIGNQHWHFISKGNSVHIPINIAKEVMETIIDNGHIHGIKIRYEEIDQSDLNFKENKHTHHHD